MSPILGIWASAQQSALNNSSYESIATVTVGAGGASDVTFSSIPSTYTHLQIRGISRQSSTNNLRLEFNADSSAIYCTHLLDGNGTTVTSYPYTGQTSNFLANSASAANTFAGVVVDILDYANTNKNKTLRTLTGWDANGSGNIGFYSGLWPNTSAVTTIRLWAVATFQQYSTFALYGIK